MSEATFASIGYLLAQHSVHCSVETGARRFTSLFGVSPRVCAIAWDLIRQKIPRGGEPKHLLWAFLFLKVYYTEAVMRTITGVDDKTQRKWTWLFIDLLAELDVVNSFLT